MNKKKQKPFWYSNKFILGVSLLLIAIMGELDSPLSSNIMLEDLTISSGEFLLTFEIKKARGSTTSLSISNNGNVEKYIVNYCAEYAHELKKFEPLNVFYSPYKDSKTYLGTIYQIEQKGEVVCRLDDVVKGLDKNRVILHYGKIACFIVGILLLLIHFRKRNKIISD